MTQKKSFKDNPAMRFISESAEPNKKPAPSHEPMPLEPGTRLKLNPLCVEVKSKRFQLLLQPSIFKRLKDTATAQGISMNEVIHKALDQYWEGKE